MSTAPLHATIRRPDAVVAAALGDMATRPWAASALHLVGSRGVTSAHAAAKPATKAGYFNPIGDGIRLPGGTG